MKKLRVGSGFFIAMFVAVLCSTIILSVTYQEELVESACAAIESHDQDMAKEYIDMVWFIDIVGHNKKTMLMSACESGNAEMIQYLIIRGADTNKTAIGRLTPLELFCRSGYEAGNDILLALLDCGAKQSVYTEKPAVFYLAEKFYWMNDAQKAIATEETITLLKHGAPMECDETTLLHEAAKSNMSDLFYILVHDAQGLRLLNAKDANGDTPWNVAVNNGAVAVQQVIRNLEREYEEEQKKKEAGQTEATEEIGTTESSNETVPYDVYGSDAKLTNDEDTMNNTISVEELEDWYEIIQSETEE